MQTKKLHELIQLAKEGKQFKATRPGLVDFIWDWDFKDFNSWSKDSILADWEYQEFREPEVVEFELDCQGGRLPIHAMCNLKYGPTPEQYESLVDKKWKAVFTEVMK